MIESFQPGEVVSGRKGIRLRDSVGLIKQSGRYAVPLYSFPTEAYISIRQGDLTKIQESVCPLSVENTTPVKDYRVTSLMSMLCKMLFFFFCILRGFMLVFVLLVPWEGKQECISQHFCLQRYWKL